MRTCAENTGTLQEKLKYMCAETCCETRATIASNSASPKGRRNNHGNDYKQHKANKVGRKGLKSSKTPEASRHKMAQCLAISDDNRMSFPLIVVSKCFAIL